MNMLTRSFFILLAGSTLVFAACDSGETTEEAATEEAAAEGEEAAAEGEEAAAEGEEAAPAEAAPEAAAAAPAGAATDVAGATQQLVGTWAADMAGMTMEGVSPEEEQMMRALMGSMVMQLTLNADGSQSMHTEMMGQVQDQAGQWAVTAVDGNTYTVNVIDEEHPEGDPGTLVRIDENTFHLVESDENGTVTIPLRRQ